MPMSPRERVMCALACGTPDVVPFAEQYIGGALPRQLLGLAPGAPYEPRQLADVLGNDVVRFSRLPPMYYEQIVMSTGEEGIGQGLIRTRDDLRLVDLPTDDAWIEDARWFLKTQAGDRATVLGTRLGLSPAINSMGVEAFSYALCDDPGLVEELLDRYVAFAKRTVEVACELGFDFIWCFDDFAFKTGPMFSPRVFREVIIPRLRPATEAISIPWVFHSDGNLFPVLDDLLSLGMAGLHPIEPEAMELGETKRALAGRACALGNVSVHLLAAGTPEQVRRAALECVDVGAPGGGYILTTGNGIPPYARLENVRALIQAAAEARGMG